MEHTKLTQSATLKKLLAIGLPMLLTTPLTLNAQAENQPDADTGQWYDPSDWFDDESLGGEDNYNYPYYGPYWTGAYWSQELDYDYLEDGYNYGIHYEWNEEAGEWEQEYGYYEDAYSYKLQWDNDDIKPADASTSFSAGNSSTNSNSNNAKSQSSSTQRSKSKTQTSSENQTANSDSSESNSGNKSVQTLSGTIDGFRKMELEYTSGLTAKHTLARIALKDGTNAVIDLGYSSLDTADLNKGDTVTLKGNRGQINGQNVFVATELNVDGETLYIERAIALQAAASDENRNRGKSRQNGTKQSHISASSAEMVTLEGKLEDHATVKLGSDSKTFVKLRLESGQAATVDLGPNTSLSDLDIKQGDQIRVRGRKTEIENRSVLTAQSISVEGESVKG